MSDFQPVTELTAGLPLLVGGNRFVRVPPALAAAFQAGDRLVVVESTGALLHVPRAQSEMAEAAVTRAVVAFQAMSAVTDEQVTRFFDRFAARLEEDAVWAAIRDANAGDLERARGRGRSTTRLAVSDKMRAEMAAGLRAWRDAPPQRGRVLERIEHEGWTVEQVVGPLGVVGFVFEGRPNVFADATGVLRGGNTVVFRIGSDALETARAIVRYALDPALAEGGLPEGAATLVESADRAAGWALFSDSRLALAVARGSGAAVEQLGSVARQAGVPVSLHGTGGAWLVADGTADPERFASAVYHSLDRKVCNTLNVCCIVEERAGDLVPLFLHSLERAGERRGHGCRLHVVAGDERHLPAEWLERRTNVRRAKGDVDEPLTDVVPLEALTTEWEWEETPEVTLKIVADVEEAVALFSRFSPQFVASLISRDEAAQARFYQAVNAPFVGDGFTRWVDGQYALLKPELGLSNWERGRLFARGAVLSGDGVYTVRTRVRQHDPELHR
jgi:glutamate-5-semialdehyde dehydrogenase